MSLYDARVKEVPPLPANLEIKRLEVYNPEMAASFPELSKSRPIQSLSKKPLKVGVVLSGGQAPGGHNVIIGLLDQLKKLNRDSQLIGFLDGPKGILENRSLTLTEELAHRYLNTGGFDILGSGRTKIETQEQFEAAAQTSKNLDGLVIIGGDDSNTNAALLAEYFLSNNLSTTVVGVPKTIDGDLKNAFVEQPFGFDTAVKVYSEILGNILKDALSAKKYWFFAKLMGRSASHITLAVAHETHPNLCLISEEKKPLLTLFEEIKALIQEREKAGKNYGIILIPEGIIEALPELPQELFKEASYDAHGNLEVSKIEVERFFIKQLNVNNGIPLFLGYEARSAFPSYFDATYGYALGHVAGLLISGQATGTMATLTNLKSPVSAWRAQGAPLLNMLHLEKRKGIEKPVIAKGLVDLNGEPYLSFKQQSAAWRLTDDYRSPGPLQFWGPKALVERVISP